MPESVPTVDQIHAYLLANGWQMGESGRAAYLIVTMGHSVRMLHEPTEYDRDKAVFDISLAEGRHPADVQESILTGTTDCTDITARRGDAMAQLRYLEAVLDIFRDADNFQALMWRRDDAGTRFAAMCSDTFAWGTADAERIEPEDVPLLRQCLADLRAADPQLGECDLPELFAARKRGMRPMRLFLYPKQQREYPGWPAVRELFLAAGPERDPKTEG